MEVFVFGNPDLTQDSLPLRLFPRLRQKFPNVKFQVLDPNEEWDIPDNLVVIDTVQGIEGIQVFENLEEFIAAPRVTMHDYDALTNLKYLKKLRKIGKIKIIGLSPTISEEEALDKIVAILSAS